VAVITRLANECPVYQSVSEFCQNTRAFTSLDELGKPNDFTATIIVSQVGEALGHSQFLNDHKEKIILCIDSRNDHDLLEFNGRGFRGLIHGPALTSELISTLNSSRASEQLAQPAMELITPTSRPCKILYVDDSEINRIAPGELLKDAGYDVSFASDGEELLGIIETQLTNGKSDFDLIITDIFMPRMDGTIAAQNIRALEKRLGRKDRLPIIAVTGYSSDQERTQIMSYGINDVIDKPVNPRELSNVLARVLGYPSPK
jgi:CheY-like chemotaxis protein